jgi:hypothetical protein
MSFLKGGVDLPDPEQSPLPEDEHAVLEKLAKKTVEKRMAIPAIIFLESIKPLNFIGSQFMVFFEPIVQTVFNFKDYNTLRSALEKRETIEILITKIEAYDAVSLKKEKKIKKFMKEEKKKWKWYQRYLGLFTPRVKIPDEVLNDPPEENEES